MQDPCSAALADTEPVVDSLVWRIATEENILAALLEAASETHTAAKNDLARLRVVRTIIAFTVAGGCRRSSSFWNCLRHSHLLRAASRRIHAGLLGDGGGGGGGGGGRSGRIESIAGDAATVCCAGGGAVANSASCVRRLILVVLHCCQWLNRRCC